MFYTITCMSVINLILIYPSCLAVILYVLQLAKHVLLFLPVHLYLWTYRRNNIPIHLPCIYQHLVSYASNLIFCHVHAWQMKKISTGVFLLPVRYWWQNLKKWIWDCELNIIVFKIAITCIPHFMYIKIIQPQFTAPLALYFPFSPK